MQQGPTQTPSALVKGSGSDFLIQILMIHPKPGGAFIVLADPSSTR